MAIIETITDEYHFWNWLQDSSGYKDNFSIEGAKAVFNYFDELSEELNENMEFDPIAWCCEFSEYDSLDEAWNELHGAPLEGNMDTTTDEKLEYFQDRTTVIELDNGHIIVGEF